MKWRNVCNLLQCHPRVGKCLGYGWLAVKLGDGNMGSLCYSLHLGSCSKSSTIKCVQNNLQPRVTSCSGSCFHCFSNSHQISFAEPTSPLLDTDNPGRADPISTAWPGPSPFPPTPPSQRTVHSLSANLSFMAGVSPYLASESPVWEVWVDLVGNGGLSPTWVVRLVACKSRAVVQPYHYWERALQRKKPGQEVGGAKRWRAKDSQFPCAWSPAPHILLSPTSQQIPFFCLSQFELHFTSTWKALINHSYATSRTYCIFEGLRRGTSRVRKTNYRGRLLLRPSHIFYCFAK